jgi:hypothetical protein
MGKTEGGSGCAGCSDSPYGRIVYTKPSWDPRIFCSIPRGSETWKKLFDSRTASERFNNRILNDYGVGSTRRRGKNRITFATLMAAINIHLDAQLKGQMSERNAALSNGAA